MAITLNDLPPAPVVADPAPAPDLTAGIPQSVSIDTSHFGESPWDVEQRAADEAEATWQNGAREQIYKVALEPDTYFKGKDLGFTRDPEYSKKMALNSAFMEFETDGPVSLAESDLQRKMTRQSVAIARFEGRGAESEEAFHAEIVKDATRRKDGKALAQELVVTAFDDAMLPGDKAPGFAAWRAVAKGKPGYDPAREADYLEAWEETRRAAAERVEAFRPELVNVWRAFRMKGNITAEAYKAWQGIEPEQRGDFLDALAIRAKALPEEERATFWANMQKVTGQIVADYGRAAGEAATSAGLAGVSVSPYARSVGEYAERREDVSEFRAGRNFAADVRRIFREDYDPLKSAFLENGKPGFWEGVAYQVPGVTGTSLTMAVPFVGLPMMALSMEGQAYETLRGRLLASGMDDQQASDYAEGLAPLVAAPQVALEKVGFGIWSRKLPGFTKALDAIGDRITNRALRFGVKAGTIATAETGVELIQDATSYAVQDIAAALTEDVPDVDWGGVLGESWSSAPEIFATMLPLAILGAAGGLSAESRRAAFAQSSPLTRRALGITDAASAAIDAAAGKGPASLNAAVQTAWDTRTPDSPEAKAAQEELKAKQAAQAKAAKDLEKLGYAAPRFVVTTEGILVIDSASGEEIGQAPDLAGAIRIARTHTVALDDLEADQVAALGSLFEAAKAAVELDPASVQELAFGETFDPEKASPEMAARFAAQVALKEQAEGGSGNIARSVLGYSVTSFAQGMRTTINKLFRGASVTDAFHETFHGLRRQARAAGTLTREHEIAMLRALDTVLAGRTTKDGTALRFIPDGMADADISETLLDEALSEIGEMELLRTRKGKGKGKLGITRGVISRNLTALAKLAPGAVATFKSFMDAVRARWGLSLSRAIALKKAERDGKFDAAGYDAFLNKLLGLDEQQEHDDGVRAELDRILGLPNEVADDDIPFSIGTDYRIQHQPHPENAVISDLEEMFGADIYGPNAIRYYGSGQEGEREAVAIFKRVKGNPDAAVTIYRVVPDFVEEINPGDWVTISKKAAEFMNTPDFIMVDKQGNPQQPKILSKKVKAGEVRWPGDSLLEQGYFPDGDVSFSIAGARAGSFLIGRGSNERLDADGNPQGIDTNSPGGANIGDAAQPGNSAVTPEMDAAYLDAVESGDLDAAQKMVNKLSGELSVEDVEDIIENASGFYNFVALRSIDSSVESVPDVWDTPRPSFVWEFDEEMGNYQEPSDTPSDVISAIDATKIDAIGKYFGDVVLVIGGEEADLETWQADKNEVSIEASSAEVFERISKEWNVGQPTRFYKYNPTVLRDSSGNIIPLSRRFNQSHPASSGALSIGPANVADIMAGNALARVKDPVRRAQAMSRMARDFQSIRMETERAGLDLWISDNKGDIRRKAAYMEEMLAEQYENEAYARHYGILSNDDLTKIKSQPAHELLATTRANGTLDPFRGRLMSKKAWLEKHKDSLWETRTAGDYDGAEGLARHVFGGQLSPSQAAKELFDAHIIKENSVDAVWEILHQEQATVSSMKEALAKAQADIREAKTKAKQEATEWATEQMSMHGLQREESNKSAVQRAIRMYDAIVLALPWELRGKMGGYAEMARLTTNDARLKFLEEKIEQADRVLEGFLREEARKDMEKLLALTRPEKTEEGNRPRGRLGPEMHDLFTFLEMAMSMDFLATEDLIDEMEAKADKLEERAEPDNTNEMDAAELRYKAQLVNLFGNWEAADAQRRLDALKVATDLYETGRYQVRARAGAKKQLREAYRESLVKGTGTTGERMDRIRKAEKTDATKWGRLKKTIFSLFSYRQIMRTVFGENVEAVKRLAERERLASNAKADAEYLIWDRIDALFTRLGKGAVKGDALRYQLATERTIKVIDFKGREQRFTAQEGITALLMWNQEDGKRHMQGRMDEDEKPLDDWHWSEEDMAEIRRQLSPEARAVMFFLREAYEAEYDRVNAVFRTMFEMNMPRHKFYSQLTVIPFQGSGAQAANPLSGALTGPGITAGSLKNRTMTKIAEPDFKDALQVFIGHSKQMEHFIHYAELASDMNAIFNNREVGNAVQAAAGVEAINVLRGWGNYFAQGGARDEALHLALNQTLNRALGRLSAAALVGRIGVLVIQSTQLGAAAYEMPVGTYLKQFAKLLSGRLDWGTAIRSEYIQRRMRIMPPSVQEAMKGLMSSKPNRVKAAARSMGRLISGADALFTAGTFAMVYDWQLAQNGGDAVAARAEAERITDSVAQPVRAGERSLFEVTGTNPAVRVLWAFASEARQKVAITAYAMSKKSKAEKSKALLVTWALSGVLSTVIRAIMRDLRSDEDDEWLDERNWNPARLGLMSITGPLGGLPIVGKEIEAALFGAAGVWAPQGSLLSAPGKAAETLTTVPDYFQGEKDFADALKDAETILTGIAPASDTASALSSFSHVLRDFYGIADNLLD